MTQRRSALLSATALLRASEERQKQKHLDKRMARAEALLGRLISAELGDQSREAAAAQGEALEAARHSAAPCEGSKAEPPTEPAAERAAGPRPGAGDDDAGGVLRVASASTPSRPSAAQPAPSTPKSPPAPRRSPRETPAKHAGWEAAYLTAGQAATPPPVPSSGARAAEGASPVKATLARPTSAASPPTARAMAPTSAGRAGSGEASTAAVTMATPPRDAAARSRPAAAASFADDPVSEEADFDEIRRASTSFEDDFDFERGVQRAPVSDEMRAVEASLLDTLLQRPSGPHGGAAP